ncbi:hypothetical protein AVEN_206919-1 [Araneus ventricosus]|uniref:Secreted protein n=1 Tax=Araneus ventricosus TaxID=182803 RepID=A0A4Y2RHA4_ARAVE|nr:hypothetical protein AVEN_206919-1 [Araneus ventricosus]
MCSEVCLLAFLWIEFCSVLVSISLRTRCELFCSKCVRTYIQWRDKFKSCLCEKYLLIMCFENLINTWPGVHVVPRRTSDIYPCLTPPWAPTPLFPQADTPVWALHQFGIHKHLPCVPLKEAAK